MNKVHRMISLLAGALGGFTLYFQYIYSWVRQGFGGYEIVFGTLFVIFCLLQLLLKKDSEIAETLPELKILNTTVCSLILFLSLIFLYRIKGPASDVELTGILQSHERKSIHWLRPFSTHLYTLKTEQGEEYVFHSTDVSLTKYLGSPWKLYVRTGILGNTLSYQKFDDQAFYSKMIAEDPSSSEPYRALIRLYLHRKEYAKVVHLAEKYRDLSRDFGFTFEVSRSLWISRMNTEAVNLLRPFESDHLEDFEFLNFYGFALARIGEKEKSVALLRKAISLEPENFQSYYHLGYVYFETGEKIQAKETFLKMLALQPNNLEISTLVKRL